jgi:hypothetical protein
VTVGTTGNSRGKTITLDGFIKDNGRTGAGRDALAKDIGDKWQTWKSSRTKQETDSSEVLAYVFATDTRTTTNSKLPWSNTTTTPKLCQIRDNLHANYMAALFPNDDWFDWQPLDEDAATKEKAEIIKAYIKSKAELSNLRGDVERLVLDYIDYGNAFATVEFQVNEYDDGTEYTPGYIGPKVVRISPLDIAFNVRAASFDASPKIVRSIVSLGDLYDRMSTAPDEAERWQEVFDKIADMYTEVSAYRNEDQRKNKRFIDDGVGAIWNYMENNEVEILEFYGTIYDSEAKKLYKDYLITVVNRSFVIQSMPYKSFSGSCPIKHVGWRLRPDTLWAMGPLNNLVGLQYRIDHLENMKADVFDKIAHPKPFIRGECSEWTTTPGEPVYGDENSDVRYISPDATALNADFQIDVLERRMEEMAGAPKQAMGIRTPGEKTAFEVQTLENASGRIFQNKIQHFEQTFLEPLLNEMLASSVRSQWKTEKIPYLDQNLNFVDFLTIEKDDIVARGILKPMGARHFAQKALLVQNLNQLFSSPLGADPGVRVHMSGKSLAKLVQEVLNLEKYKLYGDNIQIYENAETAKITASAEEDVLSNSLADPEAGMDAELDAMAEGELPIE